jgi:ribosome-binding protein aMBF1 (putative translation factor)
MLRDWIRTALDRPDFKIDAKIDSSGKVTLTVEDNAPVLALVLQRQRQKHGLTVRQVAERLKMKTHSSYAQYERGKSEPSVSQLDRFLSVIAPERRVRVKVG